MIEVFGVRITWGAIVAALVLAILWSLTTCSTPT